MIKNYLKLAFRSFWKQKLTTGINIFGLSFGIACASLAYVFIQHERSFDQFHDEADHIHWFYVNINKTFNVSASPGPLAPELVKTFPEVTEGLRVTDQSVFIQSGNEIFKEKVLFADPNFFSFFQFPLEVGTKESALSDIHSIVLTEEMARKYFGRRNPVGETLPIIFNDQETLFRVTGIAQNPPSNSSIQFSFVLPIQFEFKDNPEELDSKWTSMPVASFVRFREMEDLNGFTQKLENFTNTKYEEVEGVEAGSYQFMMNALSDYHLNNRMSSGGMIPPGEPKYVRILAIIAFLILLVACFNFMNLSNAKSSQRLTEVGVRQVLGAQPRQLRIQFLTESVLVSLLSLSVAIVLLEFLLPFSTSLFEYPLKFNWWTPQIFLPLLGIALITGLLAGSYPAYLLSKLNIIKTFKSEFKIGGNNWVTKSSLVFQFALSIGLLACTGIMMQQQKFISNKNLGFNQDQIVVIPTQVKYEDQIDSRRFVNQYRNAVQSFDGVVQVAGVSNSFNKGNRGQFIKDEEGVQDIIFEYGVEPQYIDLLGLELLEGRNFSEDIQEDKERAIIVNEAFRQKYQVEDIASYQFPSYFGENYANTQIIGVVKDYHFNHLRTSIKPMYLSMNEHIGLQHILVKIKPEQVQNTLSQLKGAWQEIRSDRPFELSFLDDDLQQQYLSETRWSNVLSGASILAIFIAFLGLFGLVALVLNQRTKEIGIRKVLGASMHHIVGLLSKDFLQLVGIALLIAAPLAWYFMDQWLQNFAYRVDIQWWVFMLSGLIVVGIAFITISLQSVKAATANPVESLRNE